MVVLKRIDESNSSPKSVELGGFKWTKVGELKGYPLYLCDKLVKNMAFSKSGKYDKWKDSDIRKWLNSDFYNTLSSDEKSSIVPYNGDRLFLLSEEEYDKFKRNIPRISKDWWLSSRGYEAGYVAIVFGYTNGDISDNIVNDRSISVRPAVLLNPLDSEN